MRLSIITATLNAEEFLADCIESVRSQSGEGFTIEHIVADGGSTDSTAEIARSGGCKVIQGKDRGLFDALNKGTAISSGDVVGCLGADDMLMPGAAEAVARWYAKRKHEWAAGRQLWVDGNGRSLGTTSPPPAWMTPAMFASLGWSCFDHQATFMTREFFDSLGGFDPDFRYSGDYKLFAAALSKSPFDRIDHTLSRFRQHGGNASTSGSARLVQENESIARDYAPGSSALRNFYRQSLRVWVNARNPAWFLGKRLHPEAYGK
jgi:glycosyltransferase involved in cell wall biosynthesis